MSLWAALALYCFWYFFIAKTVQPLTLDELALIWRLHKQQTGCKASRIHSLIESNNEVVGFKCSCDILAAGGKCRFASEKPDHPFIKTLKEITKNLEIMMDYANAKPKPDKPQEYFLNYEVYESLSEA